MSSSSTRPKKRAKTSAYGGGTEKTETVQQKWDETECGTLLYLHRPNNIPTATKIAGFDIDDTVIRTKSGKTFATNDLTDWKLWADPQSVVKPAFSKLVSDGYHIVFFTNQEGIGKGKVDKTKWKKKIENVIDALDVSPAGVTVLASLNKKGNDYRKPHVGMWRFLTENLLSNDPATIETKESFYVGDAAGRPKRGPIKKDFSCTDYKFALNLGLTFKTPEQFFYGSTKPSDMASPTTSNMGFRPREHWKDYVGDAPPTNKEREEFLTSCRRREVVVIVGSPASGKSELARRVVEGAEDVEYVRVNQDTLKTLAKCVKVATEALSNDKSVVVDNTNRDKKTREKYIELAKANKVPCRCVYTITTKEESFHANALRGAVGDWAGEDKRTVPDVVVHSFYKNLQVPEAGEGFEEVIELPFTPGPFDSEERKDAFFRFTK